MDGNSDVNKVYTNRLLQNQAEVTEFEQALSNLISSADVSIIGDLCMGFDDDTYKYEVMFGLVHGIEQLYKDRIEEGLNLIALAVPKVINRAEEWMEVLHYRILNHEQVRITYGKVLSKMDIKTKEIIINLLTNIKDEDPDMFGNSVDEEINLPKNLLIIYDTGSDELFCLDFNKSREKEEPKVVSFVPGVELESQTYEIIANDFGDFLLNLVKQEI